MKHLTKKSLKMCSSSLGIFFYADIMEYYKNLQIENIYYFDDDGISQIEQWKDILDYVGIYQVSNLGRVKSIKRYVKCMGGIRLVGEKIRKIQEDKDGYLTITLCNDTKVIFKIHRLVAIAFIPNLLSLPEVNHIKNIKTRNTVNNLEWVTSKENKEHSILLGTNARGEKVNNAKLTEIEVLKIRNSTLTQRELGEIYGVGRRTIGAILLRRTWTHI